MKRWLIGLVWAAVAVGAASAADWPQWRGPNRDGTSAETNWLAQWPPVEVWRRKVEVGFSSPVVSEGRVYVTGLSGYGGSPRGSANSVRCFDAATGVAIWEYSYRNTNWAWQPEGAGYMGTKATPAVCGNELYTFDENGGLYCLDKVTGTVLWGKDIRPPSGLRYGFSSSPLVEGNLVILNASTEGVAIDRNAPHDIVWSGSMTNYDTTGYSSALPYTVSGQRGVVMSLTYCSTPDLRAVNPVNGQLLWKLANAVDSQLSEDAVLYGDKIYFSGKGGVLLAPGTNSAQVIWAGKRPAAGWNWSSPVVQGDYVYHLNAATLECFDIRDGTTRWSKQPDGMEGSGGQLVLCDGKLILFAGHQLYVLRATPDRYDDEGRRPVAVTRPGGYYGSIWREYCFTVPALAGGRLYCRDVDELVCYQFAPKLNRAPVARNDAAVARRDTPALLDVLANDSDEDWGDVVTISALTPAAHGTAAVNGGTNVTYTPAAGYTGTDGFAYTVTDGGGFATGAVSVLVAPAGSGLAVAATATPTNGWTHSLTVQFGATAVGGQTSATNDTTEDGTGMTDASVPVPLQAFDNNTNTYWSGSTNGTLDGTAWIQHAYWNGQRKRVEEYSLMSGYLYGSTVYYYPKAWKLLGSNDRGATWTELDSRSSQVFTARQKKKYTVANPGSYATYRLRILEPGLYGYCWLYEVELLEKGYGYAWSFGDGTTSALQNPLHMYATNGAYQAQVVATDALGARATNSVAVSVSVPVAEGLPPMKMRIALEGYDRSEPLTNFPLLVTLRDNVAGRGFAYSQCASPYGWDLRFRDETETTELSHEIESWDTNGTSCVWVRVPALTNHAAIWAYWGDSTLAFAPAVYTTNGAAWDNSFRAVWHLGSLSDSTANGNAVTAAGPSQLRPGLVGNGRMNQYSSMSVPDSPSLSVTASLTLEGWIRMDSPSSTGSNCLFSKDATNASQFWYGATNAGLTLRDGMAPETVSWPYPFEDRTWYHAAMVADLGPAKQIRFYLNGTPIGPARTTAKSTIADTAGPLLLLQTAWGDGYFDELRVTGGARSENWIWATWFNIASNATFNRFGAAQPVSGGSDPYGILDSWKVQYFGSTNAPGAGSLDDPDHDGANNYAEWRAGTIPTNAQSVLRVSRVECRGEDLVVTWPSVLGRFYTIGSGADLRWPLTNPAASHLPATPPTNATTLNTGLAPQMYYRVIVDP